MKSRFSRDRFSRDQIETLEEYFKRDHYPHIQLRTKIAQMVDLHQNQVSIWFQNRRKKFKGEGGSHELVSHSGTRRGRRKRRRHPCTSHDDTSHKDTKGKYPKSLQMNEVTPDEGTLEELNGPSLPRWPIKVKYIPFQQNLFPSHQTDPRDLNTKSTTDKSAKMPSAKKTKRAAKNRKSTLENSENTIEETNDIEIGEDDLTNTQILNNLMSIIETIRKDTLYVPMMDEIYDQPDEHYLEQETPSAETSLMRSVRQFLEPSCYVQNLKLSG